MSSRRPSCRFCLEADCLCDDEEELPVRRAVPFPGDCGDGESPCGAEDDEDLPGGPSRR